MPTRNRNVSIVALLLLFGCEDDPTGTGKDEAQQPDAGTSPGKESGSDDDATGAASDDDGATADPDQESDDDDALNDNDVSDDDDMALGDDDSSDDDGADGADATNDAGSSTDDEVGSADDDDVADDDVADDDVADDDVADDDVADDDVADDDVADDDVADDDVADDDVADDDVADDDVADDDVADDDVADDDVADDDVVTPELTIAKYAYFTVVQNRSTLEVAGQTLVLAGATFSAQFLEVQFSTPPEEQNTCQATTIGDCTAQVCEEATPGTESPLVITELQPTGVTVAGLSIDPLVPAPVPLWQLLGAPDPMNDQPVGFNTYDDQLYWLGGEAMRIVVAPSETVPAFDLSLEMPSPVTMSSPASDAISTSSALPVSWTGGGYGSVLVGVNSSAGDRSISCQVPSAQGSVSIDASLLAGFEGEGIVGLVPLSSVTGTQDDWVYAVAAEHAEGLASRAVTFAP